MDERPWSGGRRTAWVYLPMPASAHDSTLPPVSSGALRLCPRCRTPAPAGSRWDATCPEHALAYVEPRALAESAQDPLLGTTLAGRFTILSRIGSGSMGSVYRARQAAVGRDVALKIVRRDRAYDPETKARFEREARAVSLLKSPHTVTAFDFGEAEDGSWFLALEMLEGETLGERLRREKRLHFTDAVRFAKDALRSLAEAHAQGIIHRDLKPDNLFLARVHDPGADREVCKILDFGIAKWVRDEEAPVDQLETLAGTVFGTPRYMSPEQAQGAPLDARSDLYSLGVLLFQMLAGRAPFVDDDAVVVMAKHIKEPPPELEEAAPGVEVPAPIEAVVRRALEKLPEKRPASAEQMLSELEQALSASRAVESGVRPHVEAEGLPESLRLATRRMWMLGALLAASLVVLVVLGSSMWSRSGAGRAATGVPLSDDRLTKQVAASQPAAASALAPGAEATVAPTPAPNAGPGPVAENSAEIAGSSGSAPQSSNVTKDPTVGAASAGRTTRAPLVAPLKKSAPKPAKATPLERRGNERYGRFD
ncbi:MAG TPA: serine/threonine-protein kinase [Polyangiaceae bacterium]|nr:serine/threonine-protein kinase [Polyangiaceae bacterium]